MNAVFYRLWLWFWHLLPANPILVRVVYGASRRTRHLWLRTGYLGALLVVVLFSMGTSLSGVEASLSDLAKAASQTFTRVSQVQLALMCFLAPVFTASAITQERDAQTFNILLATPLSNAQIVFGSLMSRLYFLMILLIASVPIFLMTMIYGGVTMTQVIQSFALSASTAVLTGSIAIFVAMIGVGTRRTIFSFYLLIGLYLVVVYLLGQWKGTWVEASIANIDGVKMSWLTALHPFLALEVSLNQVYAPSYGRLMDSGALERNALAYPSVVYVVWTFGAALVLTLFSVLFVRRGIKLGEPTFWTNLTGRFRRKDRHSLTRTPRSVWKNPVAWREAKARAAGGGLLRLAIIVIGIVAPLILYFSYWRNTIQASTISAWLASIIIVQFALALIIATNTAATSMTREKESKTIELLLTTPMSSKYILWGKLRGLVSFALPLVLGPVCVLFLFAVTSLSRGKSPPMVWMETAFLLGGLLVVYTAAACVLGLKISLSARRTVTAVMNSIGAVVLLCGVSSMLGFAFVEASGGEFAAFIAPFAPFTSIQYMVNPASLFISTTQFASGAAAARTASIIGSILAMALYAFIVWRVYSNLVKNFDMTLRKQSSS